MSITESQRFAVLNEKHIHEMNRGELEEYVGLSEKALWLLTGDDVFNRGKARLMQLSLTVARQRLEDWK